MLLILVDTWPLKNPWNSEALMKQRADKYADINGCGNMKPLHTGICWLIAEAALMNNMSIYHRSA